MIVVIIRYGCRYVLELHMRLILCQPDVGEKTL